EDEADDTVSSARFAYGEEGESHVDLAPAANAVNYDVVEDESETIQFELEAPTVEPVETVPDLRLERAYEQAAAAPTISTPAVMYRTPEDNAEGRGISFSRILSGLLLLALGTGLGLGAYYYWDVTHPAPVTVAEAPVIQEMKTTDIP